MATSCQGSAASSVAPCMVESPDLALGPAAGAEADWICRNNLLRRCEPDYGQEGALLAVVLQIGRKMLHACHACP